MARTHWEQKKKYANNIIKVELAGARHGGEVKWRAINFNLINL